MVNRHVVTKQRAPSIRKVIANIEAALEEEYGPEDREQLEKYLDYWKGRRESHAG